MNYIWLLLWLVLSFFIMGAFLWSVRILLQQKKAWKAFAKKYNLPFTRGRFFSSPSILGDFKGHRLNIYSEEQQAEDARGTRFRSVIEVMRKSDVAAAGAIASSHLVKIIDIFDLHDVFALETESWSPSYSGRTNNMALMKRYITPERFDALNKLLRLPKGGFLVVFNADDLLLRYETSDPLHDPRRIDRLVKAMLEISDTLREPEILRDEGSESDKPAPVQEAPVESEPASVSEPEPESQPEPVVAEKKAAPPKKKAAPKKKPAAKKTPASGV